MSRRRACLLGCALAGAGLGALAGPAAAAFPGLNGQIAFVRDDQIVVKAPGQLTVTPLTSAGVNADPAWSPDGQHIAWAHDPGDGGGAEIWVMRGDGANKKQLTFEALDAGTPAWSPSGTNIAFSGGNDADPDIVVIDVNGGSRLVVAGGAGIQSFPAWKPGGSLIVFRDDPLGGLASVTPNGAGRAPFLSDASQPDWSPDGSKLVVRRGSGILQVVNADGSGAVTVTPPQGGSGGVFSPDGTRIVYSRFVDSSSRNDLFTTSPTGVNEVPETNLFPLDFSPDWQPIPQAPPPPPPPAGGPAGPGAGGLAIGSASFAPKWRTSRLRGTFLLRGSVARAAQLQARVLRANGKGKPLLTRRFRVAKAGAFTRRLPLAGLLPGRYLVQVVDVGRTVPKLATHQVLATLPAPKEGVVSRSFISTALGGRARGRIAAGPGIIFATFRFAALPLKRLPLQVTWYLSGKSGAVERDRKSRVRLVTAFLRTRSGALPTGSYRAELTVGGKLVAVARVRIQ